MIDLEHFSISDGQKKILKEISFALKPPFRVGIIGESGSGKSTLAKSLVKLIDPKLKISGKLTVHAETLWNLKESDLRALRKNKIKYLVQEPFFALNPHLKIKTQLSEAFLEKPSLKQLEESLKTVELDDPALLNRYPHELSGGQRQRIALLQALVAKPKVLIADEPTTALDPLLQKQILDLIDRYLENEKGSLIFISHDLEALVLMTETIFVLYAGSLVEELKSKDLFTKARHPYTKALAECMITESKEPSPILQLHDTKSQGCAFAPFCKKATRVCFEKAPALIDNLACHNREDA